MKRGLTNAYYSGSTVSYTHLDVYKRQGMYSAGGQHTLGDFLLHLLMPACVVAFTLLGDIVKQTRAGLLEVLNEDYIKTARAKGLTEKVVIIKHGLRNSLIPIITVISLSIPYIVGGAVVIEQIFGWPVSYTHLGNVSATARALGIARNTLYQKMYKYGINVKKY